jgi:pseudouridine-5'-phosphate glycosidase
MQDAPHWPELSQPVSDALTAGRPVVALESTIITHGLPRPQNLTAAREFETILHGAGVTPATIALIDGVPKAGLTLGELERIALGDDAVKVSTADLGPAIAAGRTAGTTVAATAMLAARAGIRVFATGGLGGVHRGAATSFDESADLTVLSRTPITVVSAGVKSILDIGATLERLESLGVPVVGFGTDRFPAFWLADSGHDLDWRVESGAEVAAIMAARERLGQDSALLVANPIPPGKQLDPALHDRVLAAALDAATIVHGKDVTPFVLDYIHRETGGLSLLVNLDLVRGNIAVAAEIALAWASRPASSSS